MNRSKIDGTSSAALSRVGISKNYEVTRFSAGRTQNQFFKKFTLILRLNEQISNENLVSSEQLSAGGIYSVRGYEEAELLRDKGIVGNLEIISPQCRLKKFYNALVSGLIFYDYAFLRTNESDISRANSRTINSNSR